MAELRIPRAHSNSWYDHLATVQEGYYYPWQSVVGDKNGEDAFVDLVLEHLTGNECILEVGCGHGELALKLAPHCESIVAYDRVAPYVDLANAAASAGNVKNASFLVHDATDTDLEHPGLPVNDQSIDLIICRRGPLHWIEDAARACKPGSWVIALNPMEEPIPAWTNKLPQKLHYENSGRHTGTGSIHQSVENRLHQAGLMLHSGWSFDVPEVFEDPFELYRMVTWGLPDDDTPEYEDIKYKIDGIYDTFAEASGIVLRHCRYLWQAQIHQ